MATSSAARQLAANRGARTLFLAAGAWCLGVMPVVYAIVAFHGQVRPLLKPEVEQHIVLLCLANLLVMASPLSTTGRIDQKLTDVINRSFVVHGALAFVILITRHFYSIPMMLVGLVASPSLGTAMVFIRYRSARLRVGVLGPWHWIIDDPAIDGGRIDPATFDVRQFDLVLVTFEGEIPAEWGPILSRSLLAGKRVRHLAEFMEEDRGAIALEHFDLNGLQERRISRYRVRKRLLDLCCVALMLPVAAPILLVCAVAILLSMGRPILFIQTRVGLGGRPFKMLKLRTMRPSNPLEVLATAPDDARITKLGKWLRRFRIDELPQLWNVLKGDMSFIGPRPEWTALAERFTGQEPTYTFRHLVRPGITGWAQVRTGPAADLAETRVKLGYDLFYIKNVSFGLDIQILLRTVWTLISGGGVR